MTTTPTPTTTTGTTGLAKPMAVAVAADGTQLHVSSGPVDPQYPQRWFLQIDVPGGAHSLRAEWDRSADLTGEAGVPVDLVLGTLRARALLAGGQATLVGDDAAVRAELEAIGQAMLRFDPRTWPVDPPLPSNLRPAVESAGEFLDCVATVAEAGAELGALAGGIAGSAAAGVGAVDGAFVGGLAGGVLAGAGGAIGCGVGWAVHG